MISLIVFWSCTADKSWSWGYSEIRSSNCQSGAEGWQSRKPFKWTKGSFTTIFNSSREIVSICIFFLSIGPHTFLQCLLCSPFKSAWFLCGFFMSRKHLHLDFYLCGFFSFSVSRKDKHNGIFDSSSRSKVYVSRSHNTRYFWWGHTKLDSWCLLAHLFASDSKAVSMSLAPKRNTFFLNLLPTCYIHRRKGLVGKIDKHRTLDFAKWTK